MAAQVRVLRQRVKAVQSTQKTTKAMEMIATSRIAKAQAKVLAAAPPPWFCGSAIPVSSTPDLAAPVARLSGFNPRAP